MSWRGRGGRGGRGGASKSFNKEQLASMGVVANEMLPGSDLQPPANYPILERLPVPLTQSPDMDSLVTLRQEFIDNMQLSGSFLKLPETKTQPEQIINTLEAQLTTKEKFYWALFPSELRPKAIAKRSLPKPGNVKKEYVKTPGWVHQRCETPPQLAVAVKVENSDEEELEDQEDAGDEDEEMDTGTDYANNYFENGESYEDEDDNLDDGAVY